MILTLCCGRHAGARAADRGARVAADDEALPRTTDQVSLDEIERIAI
jgi:hypothetical protein